MFRWKRIRLATNEQEFELTKNSPLQPSFRCQYVTIARKLGGGEEEGGGRYLGKERR